MAVAATIPTSQLPETVMRDYSLITAFAVVGLTVWFSYFLSARLTRGRIHGSAIAILIGLLMAWLGGYVSHTPNPETSGTNGLTDIPIFAGMGILGGTMLRDLAIVATAMGVRLDELRRTGIYGILSLFIGVFSSFTIGACVAWSFGFHDAVSMTTIGGGTATFIVGPVTGTALGASSEVIALSVAAGLVKTVLVMISTPLVAKHIGLDNPRSALIFGGLMGSTSGVAGGLAATDPKLVPYGAMTAICYSALACLLGPSVIFLIIKAIV